MYIDETLPEGQFDWDTWADCVKDMNDPISEAFFKKVMDSGLLQELEDKEVGSKSNT